MNNIEEINKIDNRLQTLREDYLKASPNRRKFIVLLANSLKDKQKRLKNDIDIVRPIDTNEIK